MPDTDDAPPAIKARKDAWRRTLQEMESMAADLESEGWDVVAVPVGHAAPVSPETTGERSGFVHVIPGNYREPFTTAFEAGGFERYDVYRQAVSGQVFFLLELLDPESSTAILLAAQYTKHHADDLEEAVETEGVVYTHVQTLDETHLGTFRHDDPAKFFPE